MKHLSSILFTAGLLAVSCTNTDKKVSIPEYSEQNLAAATSEITLQNLLDKSYEVELIRIKDADDKPVLMPDVVDVEMTDKHLFLLTSDSRILKCNRDGVLEGNIGAKGNGPGEYLYVNDIFIAPDKDAIYLNDIMKGRIMYGLDGNYKGTCELNAAGQIVTAISDGSHTIESRQVIMGNETEKLCIRDTEGNKIAGFANHLLFDFSPKAQVTAYQEYKALFNTGGEIIFHQMSTDTVFTVLPDVPALEPRCCFRLQHGVSKKDLSSFTDVMQKISLVYDYAEDVTFRYVTLIEPGWKKHLYLIDKQDGTVHKSAIMIPETETAFYPKWQSGNKLMDYCISTKDEPFFIVLEKK